MHVVVYIDLHGIEVDLPQGLMNVMNNTPGIIPTIQCSQTPSLCPPPPPPSNPFNPPRYTHFQTRPHPP